MRSRKQQQTRTVYQCYSWEMHTTTTRTIHSFGHAAFVIQINYARLSPCANWWVIWVQMFNEAVLFGEDQPPCFMYKKRE